MGRFRRVFQWTGAIAGPVIGIGFRVLDAYEFSTLGLPSLVWEAIGFTVFFISIMGMVLGLHRDNEALRAEQKAWRENKGLSAKDDRVERTSDVKPSPLKIEFAPYQDFKQEDVPSKILPQNTARYHLYWMWLYNSEDADVKNVGIELESVGEIPNRPDDIVSPYPQFCAARLHFQTDNATLMQFSPHQREKVFLISRLKEFPDSEPICVFGTDVSFHHHSRVQQLNLKVTGEGIQPAQFKLTAWVEKDGTLRMARA